MVNGVGSLDGLLWVVIIVITLTAMLLLPARRREARLSAGPADKPEEIKALRSRASRIADEVDRMRLDLEDLHREVAARTQNKLQMLDLMIRQADERIETLRQLQNGAEEDSEA
jgi:hypothetical protein